MGTPGEWLGRGIAGAGPLDAVERWLVETGTRCPTAHEITPFASESQRGDAKS
jgi:hypothetical protein